MSATSEIQSAIIKAVRNSAEKRTLPDLVIVPHSMYDGFIKECQSGEKLTAEGIFPMKYAVNIISGNGKEIECYERMQ